MYFQQHLNFGPCFCFVLFFSNRENTDLYEHTTVGSPKAEMAKAISSRALEKKSNKAQNVSDDFEQPEMVTLKIVDR